MAILSWRTNQVISLGDAIGGRTNGGNNYEGVNLRRTNGEIQVDTISWIQFRGCNYMNEFLWMSYFSI